MSAPQIQIVRPSHQRGETRWLLLAMLGVMLLSAVTIGLRQRAEFSPSEATGEARRVQISADLNAQEQGTFQDLRLAATDITDWFEVEGAWPTLDELRALYLPPFGEDAVAQKRGGLRWEVLFQAENRYFLIGTPQDAEVSGTFVLQIEFVPLEVRASSQDKSHKHIWYQPGASAAPPVPTKVNLQGVGFREVIAFDGLQERQRLQGD